MCRLAAGSASVVEMLIPDNLRYSSDHEWVQLEGNRAKVGITDYAQDALGDIVFIDLPEVGAQIEVGQSISEVESTKSVSDIFAPLTGTVVEINDELSDAPDRLNSDPYGEGWIFVVELVDPGTVDSLLDAAAYAKLTEG